MVDRIMGLLKSNHMTAKELTSRLGVSQSTVTDWKNGKTKPSAEHIIGISQIFGVSTDYILLGEQKEPSEEGQLQWYDSKKEPIMLPGEVARLSELRADQALTARIEEVAQAVYEKEQRRDNRG